MNTRTAAVTALACAVLGTIYLYYSPSPISLNFRKMSKPTTQPPPLTFKLSQISKSPPSVLVTLRNSSPSTTFTLLRWGTPLDPQALNLGVFRLWKLPTTSTSTSSNSSDQKENGEDEQVEEEEEIKIDRLMISRKFPPSKDDLLEIGPGEEYAVEVVLDRPWMPSTTPARYKVKVEGEIKGLWEKRAGEVRGEELEDYAENRLGFESDAVVIVVE
ncbi:hypothetical protein BDV96DRAFT_14322 [Lophiotrema nucula]|uniref:Uncharacterized protein n=1 Tax=Lophiotrema nucula TaxID=690887 RepID=A0A6A5ZTX6_9PLEO|nr:hypothetical protein BDV96DRAFT_14322 [Lophiotrema nucula]